MPLAPWVVSASTGLLTAVVLLAPSGTRAQQPKVGFAPAALTETSYTFETAEQRGIRVVVVATRLKHPFALALLPNGDALVSERGRALRLVRDVTGVDGKPAVLDPQPIAGIPAVEPSFRGGGIQDVALHPQYAQNHLVYFTCNEPGKLAAAVGNRPASRQGIVTLMRGVLSGHALTHVETLFSARESGYAGGSRIAFDGEGMVYITTGAPFDDRAQSLGSVYGKVLRLRDDGSVPLGNPFVGRAGARPEIFSYGHRDQLGLTVDPLNGAVLDTEEGPNGGDKVNVILPGRNYGWPRFSFGRNYDGTAISTFPLTAGIEPPLIVWVPSLAPGNLLLYTGDRFPAWKNNLFVTSARWGEIPGTGGLERVVLNPTMGELRRETLLTQLHLRMRDVRQGHDGLLYLITDEDDGALLRIEPLN